MTRCPLSRASANPWEIPCSLWLAQSRWWMLHRSDPPVRGRSHGRAGTRRGSGGNGDPPRARWTALRPAAWSCCGAAAGEQHIGHGKTEVLQQACILRSSPASAPPVPGGCLTRRPGRLRARRRRSPSAAARGLPATSCAVESRPCRRFIRGTVAIVTADQRGGEAGPVPAPASSGWHTGLLSRTASGGGAGGPGDDHGVGRLLR